MSRYTVYVVPQALTEIKTLPGNMRQRVKREIEDLAHNPRPAHSKVLQTPDLEGELRRSRLDRWRIIYLVTESDKVVDILAVRKRPPYDYEDLAQLLEDS